MLITTQGKIYSKELFSYKYNNNIELIMQDELFGILEEISFKAFQFMRLIKMIKIFFVENFYEYFDEKTSFPETENHKNNSFQILTK